MAARLRAPAGGIAVSTSVTYASITFCPVASAIDTRWWPSWTKYISPIWYTSIGGSDSPRRWASASRSHRSRTRPVVGRNRRSKSRLLSTVPTMDSSRIVCRPRERSPRRPSAATTSSNGRIRLTSSGSRRSRWPSRASTWRRRARSKSFSTSERGNPVSATTASALRPGVPVGGPARGYVQQVTAGHVVHLGTAEGTAAGGALVRQDVPVQHDPRGQRGDQRGQRSEPVVRRVRAVPVPGRRGVGEQHVHRRAAAQLLPPRGGPKGPGPPGLLRIGVLV